MCGIKWPLKKTVFVENIETIISFKHHETGNNFLELCPNTFMMVQFITIEVEQLSVHGGMIFNRGLYQNPCC